MFTNIMQTPIALSKFPIASAQCWCIGNPYQRQVLREEVWLSWTCTLSNPIVLVRIYNWPNFLMNPYDLVGFAIVCFSSTANQQMFLMRANISDPRSGKFTTGSPGLWQFLIRRAQISSRNLRIFGIATITNLTSEQWTFDNWYTFSWWTPRVRFDASKGRNKKPANQFAKSAWTCRAEQKYNTLKIIELVWAFLWLHQFWNGQKLFRIKVEEAIRGSFNL